MLDQSDAGNACIAFAIGAWSMALVELFYPTTAFSTGKWSWLIGSIFNSAGSLGFVVGSSLFLTGYKKG